ncbi:ATP-binding protein [Marichromatium gracile]|nr:ATP-binding protein [Marichromatium gracile]
MNGLASPQAHRWHHPLAVALVMALTLATTGLLEHFATAHQQELKRNAVADHVSVLRSRLDGVVQHDLRLTRTLSALIASRPDLDQTGFAQIVDDLTRRQRLLRSISAAPGLVIGMVHPPTADETMLGLDYREHPSQRQAALQAVARGETVVDGPSPLIQGGVGLVIHAPVFVATDQGPQVWGLVSTALDSEQLYRASGLTTANTELRLGLRARPDDTTPPRVVFGDPEVFRLAPVTATVALPNLTWELAAIPHEGWNPPSPTRWLIRLGGLVTAVVTGGLLHLLLQSTRRRINSEGQLRALLDNLPDLVWLKDPHGVYLVCNPRFESFFGAPEREIVGRTDADFVDPELARFFREKDQAALVAGRARRNDEWITFASDGHQELAETIKTPVYDAAGRLIGVLGIARDITERQRQQDEIRRLNAELESRVAARTEELAALNRELETFTYSVSHDLKAPLRGIDGYSQLLLEQHGTELSPEAGTFIANIRRGVEQMRALIDDLLTYSRMERQVLTGRQIELAGVVETVLAERHALLVERDIALEVDVSELTVRADPDGLRIILRNLVDNAIKFSRDATPRPRIRILARDQGRRVVMAISDNGIGFDMRFHDRLFEVFQRLHRAEDYPGTGVGLGIVLKAAQRMGARVWAESTPGHGATFYLELSR